MYQKNGWPKRYGTLEKHIIIKYNLPFKVAGEANVSDDIFFPPHNMLGNIELNVDTTNNHLALTSYFVNPSLKNSPFGNFCDFLEMLMMFP